MRGRAGPRAAPARKQRLLAGRVNCGNLLAKHFTLGSGAQALRAAGQPVLAGLLLRSDAPRARHATQAKFVVAP